MTPTNNSPVLWEQIEGLLYRVQKPGRYVGGEYNAVVKPWESVDLHVCLAFPDLYDLGMSNFAMMIFYDQLNRRPDTLAERTYLPAPDMIAQLRTAGIPLYTLESYRPVRSFDLLGISAAYEHLYTNLLELLDLAGMEIHAEKRETPDPLVICGGHGTFNPEPIAAFADAFVIGEGEEILDEIVTRMKGLRGLPHLDQLAGLRDIPGLYIPRFYKPVYTGARFAGLETLDETTPLPIRKRVVGELPPTPTRQLVPNVEIAHDRAIVEIQRGCTRGCRFCQAGVITRPIRERSVEEIVQTLDAIVDATGYEEAVLLSLSSADYSQIGPLLSAIKEHFCDRRLAISLPSLRIDSFSVEIAERLGNGRRTGFTFAPEAGSDALRARINKDISTESLLKVAGEVFSRGWRTLKLYFMIGLPGETDEDVLAIADLARQVYQLGLKAQGRKTEVHLSVNTFIPKPHTVFQWEAVADPETVAHRQRLLRDNLPTRGITLAWNDARETRLESLLSRGDRRLEPLIESAWRLGARFDAWGEWARPDAWEKALAETGIDWADYIYRRRELDEPLPWDHLESGVDKRALQHDYRRSEEGRFLVDCREQCHACGILTHYAEFWTKEWKCPTPR